MNSTKTFIVVTATAFVFAISSACNKNKPAVEKPMVETAKVSAPTTTQDPSPSCDKTAKSCVRFAVLGDFGDQNNDSGSPEQNVASMVLGWEPQFIITVGDNNYPCGKASTIVANSQPYCDYIYNPGAMPSPCAGTATTNQVNAFFPVPGNHEWYSANATPYLQFFTRLPTNSSGTQPNQRYYDLTWKTRDNQSSPVHLFAIDSEDPLAYEGNCKLTRSTATFEPDGATVGSVQYNWYKAAVGQATEPWKIAYFHHAPYSCNNDSDNSEWMQWDFESMGTSAVLTGHQHVYQRFSKKSSKDHPYITNGAGGTELKHHCSKLGSDFGKEQYITGEYGAILAEATDTTITFFFYTTDGSDATLSDWVQVAKNSSGGGQTMTCKGC